MDDRNGALLEGFDELKEAVAEEERNRSLGFVEEPLSVQLRYDFSGPLDWLFVSANLVEVAGHLNRLFGVQLEGLELQADEDLRAILLQTVLKGEDLVFANGALHIEDPVRTIQIDSIRISTRKVYVHLKGTTAEVRWVAQKTIELLLLSSGLSLSWSDFVDEIESEGHVTRTKAHLGIDLIDFFSDRFKDFIQDNLVETDSLGSWMGTHPRDKNQRYIDREGIIVVPQIHGIEMRLSLFNKITGIIENCNVAFDVQDRREHGQGVLMLMTELDSVSHTQLISQLRSAISDQSKT